MGMFDSIKQKLRLNPLLKSCYIDVTLSLIFNKDYSEEVVNFVKKFNKAHYPKENFVLLDIIKPIKITKNEGGLIENITSEDIKEKKESFFHNELLSNEDKQKMNEFAEAYNKNFKDLNSGVFNFGVERIFLKDYQNKIKGVIKKYQDYITKIKQEKPKDMKIDIRIGATLYLSKDFSESDKLELIKNKVIPKSFFKNLMTNELYIGNPSETTSNITHYSSIDISDLLKDILSFKESK